MLSKIKSDSSDSSDSESKSDRKPLQFMVDEAFHREFKIYAATKGMKMSDLFMDMYGQYREAND